MSFSGTTESLFQWVSEMDLQRETKLAQLLLVYERQLETEGYTPDAHLLAEAETLLQERLRVMEVDRELAHLGNSLYTYLQKWEQIRQLLTSYRAQGLVAYEQAWAWWTVNDCLALERNCAAVVKQQRALLQWAFQHFSVDQCLFVMNDSTQALCWLLAGQKRGWFAIFDELMGRIPASEQNREDRFLYLRTAILQHIRPQQEQQAHLALPLVSSLYHLLQEEPTWQRHADVLLETQASHMEVLAVLGKTEQLREIGQAAVHHLTTWIQTLPEPSLKEKRQIRRLCTNIAYSLYEAKQYDLAIPLFQQAIAYGVTPPHSYMWLAACVWATTHDRSQVLSLLDQAKAHDASGHIVKQFALLPEFQDLYADSRGAPKS
ncbi:MAG: hypothetical protein JO202_03450 [Ktedonobacteraceae bacterium]|nr:hypothetical protein [Ktedonobacteraceae bacterium]